MTTYRWHTQHLGELDVQKKRHVPKELANQIPNYIQTDMPRQHALFYAGLSYLPLGTLDETGRPWVSILVTKSDHDPLIGIRATAQNELSIVAQMSPDDPFYQAASRTKIEASQENPLFAGVGVDFSNRRRNKLAGSIHSARIEEPGKLRLHLKTDEHMGNCPKYITVRSLVPHARNAETLLNTPGSFDEPLPQFCKDHINQISTVFLATKHTQIDESPQGDQSDMGLNHRGGPPGFVRVYEEVQNKEGDPSETQIVTYLVLPDYSGNRFYQSLGNVQSDPLVGLVFPDFTTGNTLHVTGHAENLFDEDAQEMMPRMSLVTRIRITGVVFVKEALNLQMISREQFSPYNPPLRYLRRELEQLGHSTIPTEAESPITATLVSIRKLTTMVSTFTFQLSTPIPSLLPGGFGVFDFSKVLDTGYMHMNETQPQAVNDDYLRTWTISSASTFNPESQQFDPVERVDITVKLKLDGRVSYFLHQEKTLLKHDINRKLEVTLAGIGGEFSCFKKESSEASPRIPQQMLWVAGGVGVTPFMSMWEGILKTTRMLWESHPPLSTDIVLVFAGRDDDVDLLRHFLKDTDPLPPSISLKVLAFQSLSPVEKQAQDTLDSLRSDFPQSLFASEQRRLEQTDLARIEGLLQREIFLCGPDGLMKSTQNWLLSLGVSASKIHQESFYF